MLEDRPIRRSIRLCGYDYSHDGLYYVTLCIEGRRTLLGKIIRTKMCLSPLGHIVNNVWHQLPLRFPEIQLDEFVIMPNHLHGILGIRAGASPAPTKTLGNIVGAYKSLVTHAAFDWGDDHGKQIGKLWQRNYYEHIVRDDNDLNRIREYIHNNIVNWHRDKFHIP